jgi:hypothetical protein
MWLDTREGGEPEAILPRSHSPLSLTLATSNPQPASSNHPGGAPGPHLQAPHSPYLTPPSSYRRCPPEHARWRLRRWQQPSSRCSASGLPDTLPPSHNPQPPSTPPVGPSTSRALTTPHPDAARCWWCKSLSSWEPQEEGMMSTTASFSLSKKPRFIVSRKKPNSRRWCWLA